MTILIKARKRKQEELRFLERRLQVKDVGIYESVTSNTGEIPVGVY